MGFGAAVLLTLACAYPLLEDDAEDSDAQAVGVASAIELARRLEPEPTVAEPEPEPQPVLEPEPEPEPEPPPPPPTPEQLSAWLDEAAVALEQLEIKTDPRRRASGPVPDGSGLREAYVDGRAMVLEGRLEQVRQWMAQAKFGSREPGRRAGSSPLSRYDLVVTRDPGRKTGDVAYFHVVVPAAGLPAAGKLGKHEAWIDEQRWINLADVLDPTRDYIPFKSNGTESLHRQWAEAQVVDSIAHIAHEYTLQTGLLLGIGDLSHVTGGKIEDHWTHQEGVDVDLYVFDPSETDADGRPLIWWSHIKRKAPIWTSKPQGKGEREPLLEPEDEFSYTATSKRLEVLAQIVFVIDEVAYFVHNDSRVLEPFDAQVGERRPGRRFLHAGNRGYWPTHADHVHLRWVEGKLPVGVTPRP